jgi:hypothetical protein
MTDHPLLRILAPGEEVRVEATAGENLVVVTDRRMAVATADRVLLDVPIENLRRIQFDIERERPATLVIVPESRHDEPQVLTVRAADYDAVAEALVTVGRRMDEAGRRRSFGGAQA